MGNIGINGFDRATTMLHCVLMFSHDQTNISNFHIQSVVKVSACWSSTELSLTGPTKVDARKSFLLTERSLNVENKEHLFDFVVTLYFTSLCLLSQIESHLNKQYLTLASSFLSEQYTSQKKGIQYSSVTYMIELCQQFIKTVLSCIYTKVLGYFFLNPTNTKMQKIGFERFCVLVCKMHFFSLNDFYPQIIDYARQSF